MSRPSSKTHVSLPPRPTSAASLPPAVALHEELQQQAQPLQLQKPLAMVHQTSCAQLNLTAALTQAPRAALGPMCSAAVETGDASVVQQATEQHSAEAAEFGPNKQPDVATDTADVASQPGRLNKVVQLAGKSEIHHLPSQAPASSAAAPKLFTAAAAAAATANPMAWGLSHIQGGAASAAVNVWGATTTQHFHGYSGLLQPAQITTLAQARPKLVCPTAAAGTVTATAVTAPSSFGRPLKKPQTQLVPPGTTLRLEQPRMPQLPRKPKILGTALSGDSSVFIKRQSALTRHNSKTNTARQLDLLLGTQSSTAVHPVKTTSHQHISRQNQAEGILSQRSTQLCSRAAAVVQHAATPAAVAHLSGAPSTHHLPVYQQQQQHAALCSAPARGCNPTPCSSAGPVIPGSQQHTAASILPGSASIHAPALSQSQPVKVSKIILLERSQGLKLFDAFAQNPTATALFDQLLAADTTPHKVDDHASSSGHPMLHKDAAATFAGNGDCRPPTRIDSRCATDISPDAPVAAGAGNATSGSQQQQQCLQATLSQWEASRSRNTRQKISDYNLSEAMWLFEKCNSTTSAAHLAVSAAGAGSLTTAATMQQAGAVTHDQDVADRALTHKPAFLADMGCVPSPEAEGIACPGGNSAAAASAAGTTTAIPPTTAASMDMKPAANITSNMNPASSCPRTRAAATAVDTAGHTADQAAVLPTTVAGAGCCLDHPAVAAHTHGKDTGAAARPGPTCQGMFSDLMTEIPPGAGPDCACCWVATTPTKKTIRRSSTTTINTDALLRTPAARPLTLSTLQAPAAFLQGDYSPHPILVNSSMSSGHNAPTTTADTDCQAGVDSSSPPYLISSLRPVGVHNLLLGWSPLPGLVQRLPGSAGHCCLSPQPGRAVGTESGATTGLQASGRCSVMSPGALIPNNPLSTLHPGTSPCNFRNRRHQAQHTSHQAPPGPAASEVHTYMTQAAGEAHSGPVLPARSLSKTLFAPESGPSPPNASSVELASQTAAPAFAAKDTPQQLEQVPHSPAQVAAAAQAAEAAAAATAAGSTKTASHQTTRQQQSCRLFRHTTAAAAGLLPAALQQPSGKDRGHPSGATGRAQGTSKHAVAVADHLYDGDAQASTPAAIEHPDVDFTHTAAHTIDRCTAAETGCNAAAGAGTVAVPTLSTTGLAAEQRQASGVALPDHDPTILEAAACPRSLRLSSLASPGDNNSQVSGHSGGGAAAAAANVVFTQPDTAHKLHQTVTADGVEAAAQAAVTTTAAARLPASSTLASDRAHASNKQTLATGTQAAHPTAQGPTAMCCVSELPPPLPQPPQEQLVTLAHDPLQSQAAMCCTPAPVTPAVCAILPAEEGAGAGGAPHVHSCWTQDSVDLADERHQQQAKQVALHPPSTGATRSNQTSGAGRDKSLQLQHTTGQLTSSSTGQQAPDPLGQNMPSVLTGQQQSSILAGHNTACHLGAAADIYAVPGASKARTSPRVMGTGALATHGAGQDRPVMLDPQFDTTMKDVQTHRQNGHHAVNTDAQLHRQRKQAPKRPQGATRALHTRHASPAPQSLKLQGQGVKEKEVRHKQGLSADAAALERRAGATALPPAVQVAGPLPAAAPSRKASGSVHHLHQQPMNAALQSNAVEVPREGGGGDAVCASNRNTPGDGFPALFFDPEDPQTLRLRPRRAAAKDADKRMKQQQLLAPKHLNSNPSAHGTQPQTPAAAAAGTEDVKPAVTAVKHAAVWRKALQHSTRATAPPAAAETQPDSTCVAQQAKQGNVGGRKRAERPAKAAAAPGSTGRPRGRPRKVRPTLSKEDQAMPPAVALDYVPPLEAAAAREQDTSSSTSSSSKERTGSSSAATDTGSDWEATGSNADSSSTGDSNHRPTGNLNVLASAAAHAATDTTVPAGAKRALPANCRQTAAKRQHRAAAAAAGSLPPSAGDVGRSRLRGGRPAGVGNRGQLAPFKGTASFGCRSARFTGVYKAQRATVRWRTQFSYARKVLNVGCFATEEEAARAWNAAAMHFRGADCWVNPVEPVLPEDGGRKVAQGLPQPVGGSLLPVMRDTDA